MSADVAETEPPVHPRGCGEREVCEVGLCDLHGSSPRVRGTLTQASCSQPSPRFIPAGAGNAQRDCRTCCFRRFIPAGAGNARPPTRRRRRQPVHPRGCGERAHTCCHASAIGGSSPRVRGTHAVQNRVDHGERFIPAGAGNARPGASRLGLRSVHPRGCGERACVATVNSGWNGSSPRVRGTRSLCRRSGARRRFIPAGAGNA